MNRVSGKPPSATPWRERLLRSSVSRIFAPRTSRRLCTPRPSGRSRERVGKHWLFVAAVIAAAQAVNAAPVPQVLTESGAISGISERGLSVYKGVPFAAPPVGDLRWRAPAAVAPWTGIREADAFAAACMQEGVSMPGETPPTVSEDCLYLNIWTPAKSAAEHLPVIVWIHGGGYRNGYAAMPLYWGDRLARKGVIVVTVAYRLGPLGFLALPELTRESPHRSSGNYGLMDQIAALEWVQRNIVGFGGDPRCVTIAGQSSGSISVSVLMASPRAKGLFQRAIGESGGLFEPLQLAPGYLLGNAERDGEKYVASLGVGSLEELRRLPAARLTGGGNAGGVTHPVIEPYLLPVAPYEAFAAGRQNDGCLCMVCTSSDRQPPVPRRCDSRSRNMGKSAYCREILHQKQAQLKVRTIAIVDPRSAAHRIQRRGGALADGCQPHDRRDFRCGHRALLRPAAPTDHRSVPPCNRRSGTKSAAGPRA